MDRIALSKRLEGLSQVFANETPFGRDLKAMSHVLANMSEEKFASVLNATYEADEAEKEGVAAQPFGPSGAGRHELNVGWRPGMGGEGGPAKKPIALLTDLMKTPGGIKDMAQAIRQFPELLKAVGAMAAVPTPAGVPARMPAPAGVREASEEKAPETKEAAEEPKFEWTVEASDAVRDGLLRDVLGMDKKIEGDTKRHLTPDQVPDGTHKQEKPATLKDPQTPQIKEVLDSGIVEKSHGAARKEAAETPKVEATKEAAVEAPKVEATKEATKVEEKKEEAKEATKVEEKKEEPKEAAKNQNDPQLGYGAGQSMKSVGHSKTASEKDVYGSEGIELTQPMVEVSMSDAEVAELSKLF